MTSEEKFTFDLEGYLVIRNVLTADEVQSMNQLAEKAAARAKSNNVSRPGRPSLWDKAFQDLIDHPTVTPYLTELLGPKFRIDHDYGIRMTEGMSRGRLHGGESEQEADHWYKYADGLMRNGLTVVIYALTPARIGDGGFCCIPGSHKTNFLACIPKDVRQFEQSPHYVVQPELKAGDALIFTEALVHGTMPWTSSQERRALLYKYSPGHSSWTQSYYDLDEYTNLTEQQKRIMAPPFVGARPDSMDPFNL